MKPQMQVQNGTRIWTETGVRRGEGRRWITTRSTDLSTLPRVSRSCSASQFNRRAREASAGRRRVRNGHPMDGRLRSPRIARLARRRCPHASAWDGHFPGENRSTDSSGEDAEHQQRRAVPHQHRDGALMRTRHARHDVGQAGGRQQAERRAQPRVHGSTLSKHEHQGRARVEAPSAQWSERTPTRACRRPPPVSRRATPEALVTIKVASHVETPTADSAKTARE